MICASCGKANTVSLTEKKPETTGNPLLDKPPVTLEKIESKKGLEDLTQTAFERLVPESGDGFRCPKCIRLIEPDTEHCPHCGLQIDVGVRHGDDAPWDRAPEGKEEVFEQAVLLWRATESDPTEENFEKFVRFTNENELWDLETRRLRWFLVAHPEHEVATAHLKKVAEKFQSRVAIAEATSKARAQNFEDGTQRFKQKLLIGAAVFWGIMVVVVGISFVSSC